MPSERVQRQIDRLLDEAERALTQRDWATVRDRARDALALDPENGDARTFLAAADRALNGTGVLSSTRPSTGSGRAEEVTARGEPVEPRADAPTHPTAFAGGRYQVRRFLGEGGKKRVYLAHDTLLDRDVAFALTTPRAGRKW